MEKRRICGSLSVRMLSVVLGLVMIASMLSASVMISGKFGSATWQAALSELNAFPQRYGTHGYVSEGMLMYPNGSVTKFPLTIINRHGHDPTAIGKTQLLSIGAGSASNPATLGPLSVSWPAGTFTTTPDIWLQWDSANGAGMLFLAVIDSTNTANGFQFGVVNIGSAATFYVFVLGVA